jgi:integrase
MQNRTRYHDSDLIFAKEWANIRKRVEFLGTPLAKNNWSQREHRKLCEDAGVRTLKFHATRHSAATMLLSSGEAVPVVSKRLGHSKTSMTTDIYGHSLPDAETRAANKAGQLVHGRPA